MAIVTGDVDVRSCERKVGPQIVIKGPYVPGDGVMARTALIVEIATVWIVFRVASNTRGYGVSVFLCFVAVLTFSFIVSAEQRKRTQIMIEE